MQYSVVNLKQVRSESSSFRLDAEFFAKKFIFSQEILARHHYKTIKDLSTKVSDFGAYSQNNIIAYQKKGYAFFIRNQDVQEFYIDDVDKIYITQKVYKALSLHLEKGDILIQRTGAISKSSIVQENDLPATANQNLAQVKIGKSINPYYLVAYLNCRYGKLTFERSQTGNVQSWLNLEQIKSIKIPVFNELFQQNIEDTIKQGITARYQSKALYTEAEELLLEELELKDWKPKHQLSFVRNFSDTQKAQRLDAEYFQPKYDEIIHKIASYYHGFCELGDICKIKNGSFVSDEHYTTQKTDTGYIRIKEIEAKESINKDEIVSLKDYIKTNETCVIKNDFVIATIGNTIGKIGRIDLELEGYIISNNTSRIRLINHKINPLYFEMISQSWLFQQQVQKNLTQTAQPKISNLIIKKIVLPLLPNNFQDKIAEKVREVHRLREESKRLLEVAKQAVEIAIEKNEEVAIKWLEENRIKKLLSFGGISYECIHFSRLCV